MIHSNVNDVTSIKMTLVTFPTPQISLEYLKEKKVTTAYLTTPQFLSEATQLDFLQLRKTRGEANAAVNMKIKMSKNPSESLRKGSPILCRLSRQGT